MRTKVLYRNIIKYNWLNLYQYFALVITLILAQYYSRSVVIISTRFIHTLYSPCTYSEKMIGVVKKPGVLLMVPPPRKTN